ncbi:hypothetical protein Clacol_003845 [Clathrus columnatus]|uniref:Hemimethylated DNA-binding domain-containing protein n=1 Tax=Clathrus columnatus TaxID=1419009 RepID=A0AAV5A7I5_9AGAM|nr:hypothetical protein Clacol_003845 [Clathrus columnatus]
MGIPQLPTELLERILWFLPIDSSSKDSVRTLCRFGEANSRFLIVSRLSKIWKDHYLARWSYFDSLREVLRTEEYDDDFATRYRIRDELDVKALRLLHAIMTTTNQDERESMAFTIVDELGLDVWDALEIMVDNDDDDDDSQDSIVHTKGLTDQYWAKEISSLIARHRAIKIWSDLCSPFVTRHPFHSFEMALSALSAFFGYDVTQDQTALPISLVYVFTSVARRLGYNAHPVAFPYKVLAVILPPEEEERGERVYVDVYDSENQAILSYSELPPMLRNMGIDLQSLQGFTSAGQYTEPAKSSLMLLRAVKNIISSLHGFMHVYDGDHITAHCATYTAASLLTGDRRLVRHLFDGSEGPLDRLVTLKHSLRPHLPLGAQEELDDCLQAYVRPSKSFPRNKGRINIGYYVGMLFRHKRYDYVGLIQGWDYRCEMSGEWITRMRVDELPHGREQPFYDTYTRDGQTRYVAEEHISPLNDVDIGDVDDIISNNKSLGRWFGGVEVYPSGRARFVQSEESKFIFPDDEMVARNFADRITTAASARINRLFNIPNIMSSQTSSPLVTAVGTWQRTDICRLNPDSPSVIVTRETQPKMDNCSSTENDLPPPYSPNNKEYFLPEDLDSNGEPLTLARFMFKYGFRSNAKGQLGHNNLEDSHRFKPCHFSLTDGGSLTTSCPGQPLSISCGSNHTILLLRSGFTSRLEIWGCGNNQYGQLGFHSSDNMSSAMIFQRLDDKVLSKLRLDIDQYQFHLIAASWDTTFIVLRPFFVENVRTSKDILVTFGSNESGNLGLDRIPQKLRHTFLPSQIDLWNLFLSTYGSDLLGFQILDLVTGVRHIILLVRLYVGDCDIVRTLGWGTCRHGQLGQMPEQDNHVLTRPTFLSLDVSIRSIALGSQHSIVLDNSGHVKGFGSNRKGQLEGLENISKVIQIGATWNGSYTVYQETSQSEWCISSTGSGHKGQLGRSLDSPSGNIIFPFDATTHRFIKMACGSEHALVYFVNLGGAESLVWGWGWNEHGNLGIGNTEDVKLPILIHQTDVDEEITNIWAGYSTSWIAIRKINKIT